MTNIYNPWEAKEGDWLEGDRVLVKAECMPPGGILGTVTKTGTIVYLDRQCAGSNTKGRWDAQKHQPTDSVGLFLSSNHAPIEVTLHNRKVMIPPRPADPEPFTRTNGDKVIWKHGEYGPYGPNRWWANSAEDARRFAAGYTQIAKVLEHKEKYGS
jgi:hypothetical protein